MASSLPSLVLSLLLVLLAALPHAARANFGDSCAIGSSDCIQCEQGVTPECQCARADFVYWLEEGWRKYEDVLQDCAIDSVFEGGSYETTLACLRTADGTASFSDTCDTCFAGLINCTFELCTSPCSNLQGNKNPACRECVAASCDAEFLACSGWSTTSCSECVPEDTNLIKGFPNAALFACAGVVGLGLVFIAVRLLRRSGLLRSKALGLDDIEEEQRRRTNYDQSPLGGVVGTPRGSYSPSQPGLYRNDSGLGGPSRLDLEDYDEKPNI